MINKKYYTLFYVVFLISTGGSGAAETARLGNEARVTALFSYPNCPQGCSSSSWTLNDTVQHYLRQSMKRDGLSGSEVQISVDNGEYAATFTGPAAVEYPRAVEAFLSVADTALAGFKSLERDNKTLPDWRFFLPLGLAWTAHPTVELLHFPPDYVLTKAQDYMSAATTLRWSDLLEHQGLNTAGAVRNQAIVDIAPIAAPATAGRELEEVYPYFNDYVVQLLQLWLKGSPAGVPKPMIVFGRPVHSWLKQNFHIDLNVLDLGSFPLPLLGSVPIIAANHPSYIFYVVTRPGDSDAQRFANGMKATKQDVIAACWQALLGLSPSSDPSSARDSCTQRWETNDVEICKLLETEAYHKSEDEAEGMCTPASLKGFSYPSDMVARQLLRNSPF